ncbi:pimeloyl-ACP methyl ester carboxylesterase [Sphingomonas sp. F9_3S_D5_B_2]
MRLCALILAALAASTLDWSGTAHAAPAANAEQRLPHISITSIGKGSPIVLIPGLSTPRAVWDGVVPELAASHRLILVQVNGFAGDEPGANLKPGVIDGVVADLHGYLAANKLTGVKVVGHSLGGLAALELANTHPADTSALMIVDALPYVGSIFVPGATVEQLKPQAAAMRDQLTAGYGRPAAGGERTAATMAITPAAQARVAAWIAKADSRVVGEAMYEDLTTDLRPDMASIATPITLVYPTTSAMPKERADPFYRGEYANAPNVNFVRVENAGHFVMLDQPQAFAAALRNFLK